MAEYINRDTFLEQQRAWYCKDCNRRKNSKGKFVYEIGEAPCRACDIGTMLDAVEDYPAADVVERKTGKWCADYDYAEYDFDGSTPLTEPRKFQDGWQCSLCGGYSPSETNYCYNCGAKMIGDDDDWHRVAGGYDSIRLENNENGNWLELQQATIDQYFDRAEECE